MNIQIVAQNLRNTIAGKETYLQILNERADVAVYPQNKVFAGVADMLAINIDELKRILADVESCVAKDVEQSWRDNPDRSGGQFTQDEIDRSGGW